MNSMAQRLQILTYHRVLPKADSLRPGCMPVDVFASHMRVLSRFFNVLPLADAVQRLRDKSLPARAVCITFDDGYADNHELAWPVLHELGLPWTIFVATDYLDGGRMWNDSVIDAVERAQGGQLDLTSIGLGVREARNATECVATIESLLGHLKHVDPVERENLSRAIADLAGVADSSDLMLTSQQLTELANAGVEIGGHTVTHPILKVIDAEEAEREICQGKEILEGLVRGPVRSFAYPNGRPGQDYDDLHADMVRRSGFTCAVSTEPGVASPTSDTFQLPRFGPWEESPLRFGLRMLKNLL